MEDSGEEGAVGGEWRPRVEEVGGNELKAVLKMGWDFDELCDGGEVEQEALEVGGLGEDVNE